MAPDGVPNETCSHGCQHSVTSAGRAETTGTGFSARFGSLLKSRLENENRPGPRRFHRFINGRWASQLYSSGGLIDAGLSRFAERVGNGSTLAGQGCNDLLVWFCGFAGLRSRSAKVFWIGVVTHGHRRGLKHRVSECAGGPPWIALFPGNMPLSWATGARFGPFQAPLFAPASRFRVSPGYPRFEVKALRRRSFLYASWRPASGQKTMKRAIRSASIRSVPARVPRRAANALTCAGGSC